MQSGILCRNQGYVGTQIAIPHSDMSRALSEQETLLAVAKRFLDVLPCPRPRNMRGDRLGNSNFFGSKLVRSVVVKDEFPD